jgi:hypothetical protein
VPRAVSEGPDLERQELGHRALALHLDRLVQVRAVEQIQAAHELLGLRERAVGHQRLAAADPYRHRLLVDVQRPPEQLDPAGSDLLLVAGELARHLSPVLRGLWSVAADDR